MLNWAREMTLREVERIQLGRDWLKRAVVKLHWAWLGEDYRVQSTGEVETMDTIAAVTISNVQPPLPSPLRKEPYEFNTRGE